MRIFSSLKSEFSGVLHNRKLLIAIIGVMIVPLLYSGTFLWAFWNPYGHVDRMPVAVVNQDQGAKYNGEKIDIGHELVVNLKRKKTFNWKFVSEKQANEGLKSQKYYIKIEIPKDFSKNAATLQSDHPQKLTIIYTPNEGFNYLSSKIGDSAIEKIKEEVSSSVTKTYAESMFTNIKAAAAGLDKASKGSGELSKGMNQAKLGAGDLKNGIIAADKGSMVVNSGADDIHSGALSIEQNLNSLAEKSVVFSNGLSSASTGSKGIQSGLSQFNIGLNQMMNGNSDLLNGAKESKAGTKQLSDGLNSAATMLPTLQNGSKQLSDGTKQLSTSLEQFNNGAQSTEQGAIQVSTGLQQAVEQVSSLAMEATDPTEKAKLESLQVSLEQLSGGSNQVQNGVDQLATNASLIKQSSDQLMVGATQLNQGQSQFAAGLTQLANGANQLDKGQSQLVGGLELFGEKIGEAQTGVNSLSAGSESLTSGLSQLSAGSIEFENGANQLAGGAKKLANGTTQLSNGAKSLTSGMNQLTSGSSTLVDGMEKLSNGSNELSSQLKNGVKNTTAVKANDRVYDMFAKPVELKDQRLNHVPDYGTGFTPYFLSLSLFVGALMLSIIFPMLEPASEPTSGVGWFIGKLGILLGVGIAQALLADFVLLQGLGLVVKSTPYFILLSIFTSWTFLAIIQFLVTVLDNPGRFLGIIVLILQLTGSAGTYPIELVPKVLQKINPFLPMTYTIAGFRSVISTADFGFMWENIGFISIFFVVFLFATLTFFNKKFKRLAH